MSGCGCKNKGNQTNAQSPVTQADVNAQRQVNNQNLKEEVKSAIRKTVEKYYNVEKKTNGWVK